MNKILEWFTKKKIVVFSIMFIFMIPLFMYLTSSTSSFLLERWYESIIYFLFIFIPIIILSIINLYIKNNTFNIWRKFTFFYLFFYLLLIIITPSRCSYLPLCEEFIFIYLVPLYFILSLILIIYQSLKTK